MIHLVDFEKPLMHYKCTLSAKDDINKQGWKLCHIHGNGSSTTIQVEQLLISDQVDHFKKLINPSNHFLIPLEWPGLAEVSEVITEIQCVKNSLC
jgi:hypothetical protein